MYRALRLLSRHPKAHCALSHAISPANSRIMHAFKGGWARQTFALAKSNDKVEKKSGVRLSKKERRVMVESFIKTYQSLNNGTFPSVHVTHKEVGGSYYIVREIVRDLIQENKVLAPPKVLPKEHNSLPGDYPVGSIALEPQISSILPPPNDMDESDHEATAGEVILESENSTDQSIDDKLIIGQNAPVGKLEEQVRKVAEDNESLFESVDDFEKSKLEQTVEQTEPSVDMISRITKAVEVETFPLQATVKYNDSLNASSEDTIILNSTTPETVADLADLYSNSPVGSVEDLKAGPGKVGETANEHKLHKTSEISLGTINYVSSKEGFGADVKGIDGQKDILSHGGWAAGEVEQSQELAADEPFLSSNTTTVENLTRTVSDPIMKSNQQEVAKSERGAFRSSTDGTSDSFVKSSEQKAIKAKCEDVQSSTGFHRNRKPAMDRINLESWEETSRKPAHEGSPFSAFVKACVAVVSKLWSKK